MHFLGVNIFFVSLGCDKNLVDSEIMIGLIAESGHKIVSVEEEADVIIVNTCGFKADATEEGIENILDLSQYKQNGRCKGLIVTGCMVQRYKDDLMNEFPEVDSVVAAGHYEGIIKAIDEVFAGRSFRLLSGEPSGDESLNLKRVLTTPSYFAYLKIAEGCDNFCTYCTIPSIRGKYKSRTFENIIEEAKMLVAQGVKELILVAQDTSLYGKDLYGKPILHELLAKLSEIEDLVWIRIMYCYPEHITDELIHAMATLPKVCHYLDMPLQHASSPVLKRMGRRSTKENLVTIIQKLRNAIPDICLRTTFITGFPGETEDEFHELFEFVSEIKFDRLGVFTYSREEGTPSYSMEHQIDEAVKEERKNKIMELQNRISKEKCSACVGKTLTVVTDGFIPDDDIYMGRTYKDAYEIDGLVFFTSETTLLAGDFVNVLITAAHEYDLVGEMIDELSE